MNEGIYSKLGSKGWSREDLIKANNIFQSAQEKKHHMVKLLDEFIYWFVLIVAIIGNLIVSVVLVPFLLVFHAIFLYGIISVIALTFGFLFIVIIDDLKELERKEHIVAGVFIPSLALVNVYFMVNFANHLNRTIRINEVSHNPIIVSLVYVIAFTIPYVVSKVLEKKGGVKEDGDRAFQNA